MPFNPTDLMSQMYDFFRALYPASSPQAFLSFEPTGFPVSPEEFVFDNALCAPMGLEWVSHLANKTITFSGGNLQHGSTVVDGFVQLMVNGCKADNADAMVLLGEEKNAALVQTGITQASLSGIPDDSYHPVVASPVNWFDTTQAGNWTSYTSGQPPQNTPPPPVVVTPPPPPITWKVGPPRRLPLPIRTGDGGGGRVTVPGHGPGHMLPMTAAAAPVGSAILERPIVPPAGISRTLALTVPDRLAALNSTLAVSAADNKATSQQQVASSNISLQCQYCTVTLNWPWLPESFLLARDWHLPGYAQGAFSNGTGSEDPGMLPVIPSGFLVVRNLAITAQWSGDDVSNLQNAAGFGPFSLAGSSFDKASGTLSCPGMQIIGWFCSALPVLPPSSDPSLPLQESSAGAGQSSSAASGTTSTPDAATPATAP